VHARMAPWLRRCVATWVLFCFCTVLAAPVAAAADEELPKKRSILETMLRGGAALAATTAIKGLFGMAPGYLATLIPAMGPAMTVPLLVGAGLLEGAISLTVFSAIMGQKERRWLVRSFLLASVASVAMTYFLGPLMAPWAVTVLSNVVRLGIFALLTRPPDKGLTEHLVDEVKSTVKGNGGSTASPDDLAGRSAAELEQFRRQAYAEYLGAADTETRADAYERFKKATDALSNLRSDAAATATP